MWGTFFKRLVKAVVAVVITVTINFLGEWANS